MNYIKSDVPITLSNGWFSPFSLTECPLFYIRWYSLDGKLLAYHYGIDRDDARLYGISLNRARDHMNVVTNEEENQS